MEASFSALEEHLRHLSPGDRSDVRRAFDFASNAHRGELREDGSPYILHPIAVATTLGMWGADRDTIIAALLHDVLEDTSVRKTEILQEFGRHVALLVEGVTKFTMADLSPDLPLDRKIETLRKLFEVMRLDVRSILIKLADRLHNIETIDVLSPDRRRRFALETLTVYYRIAYHLGMRDIRRTFAEAAVPYAYDDGTAARDLRDRMCQGAGAAINDMEDVLRSTDSTNVIMSVFLQPRNLSIFYDRVHRQKGEPLLRDAFTVVVVVRSEEDCYHLLQTLHTHYRPISGQFRDYIAAPTDAGYRGIHTLVALSPGGTVEVRIRAESMEEQSKRGVAPSLFQAGTTLTPSFAWLQRSEELDLRTRESSSAFWEALASDILQESLPVAVDGTRVSLPIGSTALDAAYVLYDARAHCIASIAVNDRSVSLSHALAEGDEVRCTFGPMQAVTGQWLSMVSTQHARFRIVDVLKQVRRSEKVTLGSTLLQRELAHFGSGALQGLSRSRCTEVAKQFHREGFEEVLAMVGDGTLRPRDVYFSLFPEQPRLSVGVSLPQERAFRLRIVCMPMAQSDLLASMHSLLRMYGVVVGSLNVWVSGGAPVVSLSGTVQDRIRLADFLDALEREEWTSSVHASLPFGLKIWLVGAALFAFFVTVADVILFPWYQDTLASFGFFPQFLLQALPLIPILLATGYLLRLLRGYIVWMRSERWSLALAFGLNILGFSLVLWRMFVLQHWSGIFPLLAVFALALLVTGYAFLRVESLYRPADVSAVKIAGAEEWRSMVRKKIAGYAIRILAVIMWGVQPLFIRYSPAHLLSPFLRTFFLALAVVGVSSVFMAIRRLFGRVTTGIARSSSGLLYNRFFFSLIIAQVGVVYFKNLSLQYTSSTNVLLLNNFAPIFGLFIAAMFWRQEIPYLRHPKTMLGIFALAMIASIGSSLLVYSSALADSSNITGDLIALLFMLCDVVLVVSQIEYIKSFRTADSSLLNFQVFLFVLFCTSPVVLLSFFSGHREIFTGLTGTTILFGLGIGIFEAIGRFCNYEAFKRIDGYLAHMLYNISVLISFVVEAYVFHSIQLTFLLIVSGVLILGASVGAEIINSHCERKGL